MVAITVRNLNNPPVASAGADQATAEGTAVSLDGSGSYDSDMEMLTSYNWVQIAGTQVSLDCSDPAQPTFIAPVVSPGGETLTFELTVSDGLLFSAPDVVNITVTNVNNLPVADAGPDQVVAEGVLVTLVGIYSYDSDGETLTFSWRQIGGPAVVLSGANTPAPSFTAPDVGAAGTTLTFELIVQDVLEGSSTDTVHVLVENLNHPPIAHAGLDQTKHQGNLVTLDGRGSSDPDGDTMTYVWLQLSGPAVTLSDANSAMPVFTAPPVGAGGATLMFQLTVNDGLVDSVVDEVVITVLSNNQPPVCHLAVAQPDRLWPPNHKLAPVDIVGVTDPDNNQMTLTVTTVTQDEPASGLGDGDTSPDAVLQGNRALLRAERSGVGNGRVYQITFTAADSLGGNCQGTVSVCVPHSRQAACSDSGQVYQATQP